MVRVRVVLARLVISVETNVLQHSRGKTNSSCGVGYQITLKLCLVWFGGMHPYRFGCFGTPSNYPKDSFSARHRANRSAVLSTRCSYPHRSTSPRRRVFCYLLRTHLCIGVPALSASIIGPITASWSNKYRDSLTSLAYRPGPRSKKGKIIKLDPRDEIYERKLIRLWLRRHAGLSTAALHKRMRVGYAQSVWILRRNILHPPLDMYSPHGIVYGSGLGKPFYHM